MKLGKGWLVLLLGIAFVGSACNDDLYASCVLDATSPDPAVASCGSNDGPSRSCVVENYVSCETRACGRFGGSDPFCTRTCGTDADCDGGRCVEFVFQSGVNYCVEEAILNQ